MQDGDEPSNAQVAPGPASPRRRWLLWVGLGLVVIYGTCSIVLPAYKIPSGSMMPTLASGDHIFVSRLAYALGELERGDVIVFRYPIEPSQLFFKRLIGLPGDEVKVQGRQVSIKRAGAQEFEVLARTRLDRPCIDLDSEQPVPRCTLYEETLDGKTYVVRYKLDNEERMNPLGVEQVWKVPEGHLFVLGDNRNDSLDSRRWAVPVAGGEQPAPFLPVELVTGRVERIYWPPSRWQPVH